jgi:hypothetical protein
MFVRADRLLGESAESFFSKHVIDFHWEEFHPHLVAFERESRELVEVDLDSLDLIVSDMARCVGSFADDGTYLPCPQHAAVTTFSQCKECAGTWIPFQECVFEPKCDGSRCDLHFCKKPHLVYAAFYGDVVKIGMTGGTRLRERAIEQGADAVVPLIDCPNRLQARQVEKEVARRLRLTQAMGGKGIAAQILKNPASEELERRYRIMAEELSRTWKVRGDQLTILDEYPFREPLDGAPAPVATPGTHRGITIGIKGKFLFYRADGQLRMLELADLPGRFVELAVRKS